MRVAFVLRSAEVQPLFRRFVHGVHENVRLRAFMNFPANSPPPPYTLNTPITTFIPIIGRRVVTMTTIKLYFMAMNAAAIHLLTSHKCAHDFRSLHNEKLSGMACTCGATG